MAVRRLLVGPVPLAWRSAGDVDQLAVQADIERVAGSVGGIAACPDGVGSWRGEADGIAGGRTAGDLAGRDDQRDVNIGQGLQIARAGVAALAGLELPVVAKAGRFGHK